MRRNPTAKRMDQDDFFLDSCGLLSCALRPGIILSRFWYLVNKTPIPATSEASAAISVDALFNHSVIADISSPSSIMNAARLISDYGNLFEPYLTKRAQSLPSLIGVAPDASASKSAQGGAHFAALLLQE